MIGILDVGGGNRGSYGAGVMDYFLKNQIAFDYGIGVSAGSANVCAYFAGQYRRNYRFYTGINLRKESMSFSNMLKTGSFVDVEYIFGAMSNDSGEEPLDYAALMASGKPVWIVATDAYSGKPVYFRADEMQQNDYGAIKASSSVAGVNLPYAWRGGSYYDGAISDPIPVDKAFRDGCEKVLVILTRPKDYFRTPGKDRLMSIRMRKKYPGAADAFIRRSETYNEELRHCLDLEKEGRIMILAPDSIGHMKTLGNSAEDIRILYRKGWADAAKAVAFVNG